ncbi:MAG: dienelactone hydrolase family protein [Pseudomonadota bacterium]
MNLIWMLAGTYLAYAVLMVWLHPRFIYPFGPDVFDNPTFQQRRVTERQVAMATSFGDDDLAVLYFMGNGGALNYFTFTLDAHQGAGRTIAAMEYPGGGGIPGKPSEHRLKADALAAYDWLAGEHDGPIVVHGFSLGTGIALHVAAARPVHAVILDAPYVRLCELMTSASYLPACKMPFVQKWDSARYLTDIQAPVLVQHGTADQLIPIENSLRMVAMLDDANVPVSFQSYQDATHNNLAGQTGYADRISTFLRDITE